MKDRLSFAFFIVAFAALVGAGCAQQPISFDAYGDVQRDIYIMRVSNGEFVVEEVVSPFAP